MCSSAEKSKLQLLGLIEHAHDGGFNDSNAFCLTMKAKRALFTELDVKLDDEDRPQRGMTRHNDITAHQLFYDEATSRQVDELTGLLSEDNYQKIRQRLQDKGFRCGFTCLFYGSPGTGKTETVLQLARQTGRDIMQVNVSEIKSKWVGDSEKNIKAPSAWMLRDMIKDNVKAPLLEELKNAEKITGKTFPVSKELLASFYASGIIEVYTECLYNDRIAESEVLRDLEEICSRLFQLS